MIVWGSMYPFLGRGPLPSCWIWSRIRAVSAFPILTNSNFSIPSGNHGARQWVPCETVTQLEHTRPITVKKLSKRPLRIEARISLGQLKYMIYTRIKRRRGFGIGFINFIRFYQTLFPISRFKTKSKHILTFPMCCPNPPFIWNKKLYDSCRQQEPRVGQHVHKILFVFLWPSQGDIERGCHMPVRPHTFRDPAGPSEDL